MMVAKRFFMTGLMVSMLLAMSSVQAAEKGTVQATIPWDGEGQVYQVNTSTLAFLGSLKGIMYIESAFATSMRCGTHIVTAGMRDSPGMYEVLKRCGEPFDRYGGTWVYKQSSSVSRYVTFTSDGRLLSIE